MSYGRFILVAISPLPKTLASGGSLVFEEGESLLHYVEEIKYIHFRLETRG